MKIAECLTKEQKQQLNRIRSRREKPPNIYSSHEELSHQEWEEIMGVHRDTFKRVRGKIRRR